MKSWYVIYPEPRIEISKPALYCVSDSGCFREDEIALAFCLRACFRESRVAISVRHGYMSISH